MLGPAGPQQLQEMIQRLINLSVGLAFIVLTVVLLIAGLKYLTSGGDPKALASAGNTITWALLGIVFMILAWLILLLIEKFTGVNVTHFCIPGTSGC
ncbi:pilin [Patescibacteria group bacterium]|nr:pilin [Patescibacteria group bacterium]MCL5410183.1 pilin [Patescibacteria group bacterium]